MNSNTRLIVNTLAQHVRTMLNIVLSLVSTRIALQALGQSDYGIYMLVAGIVSLLSYLSNTLVVTTQRHLSVASGEGNREGVKLLFANSYMLHILLGVVLAVGCLSLTAWLFNGTVLNIPEDKLGESQILYGMVVLSVLMTFLAAPFRALLISHENIVYISCVEVLDGALKLGLVFTLFWIDNYRLAAYGAIMAGIMALNWMLLAGYAKMHYEECILLPRMKWWRSDIQRKIIGFATWTLYGMLCIYARTQGMAVALNRFMGTVANAAFGIATQVFGSIQFLSQAILNAIAPQIMHAEGAGERERAIRLSFLASKYCYLMLAIIAIPLVFEMPQILHLWLGDVPKHSVLLADMMLIASLCDQTTIGLGKLNQAMGKIRNYTLITFTFKVLTLPFVIICLKSTWGISGVCILFILFELLSALVRLPILAHTAKIDILTFLQDVLFRLIIPTLGMITVCVFSTRIIPLIPVRFLITGTLSVLIGSVLIWLTAMSKMERQNILEMFIKKNKN